MRSFHSPRYKLMIQRLREARARSGLTQVEAAAALGQPQNFVSKCETGERIDALELADFAALYRTTSDALVPPSALVRGGRSKRVAEPTVEPKSRKRRRARNRRSPERPE